MILRFMCAAHLYDRISVTLVGGSAAVKVAGASLGSDVIIASGLVVSMHPGGFSALSDYSCLSLACLRSVEGV